MWLLIRSRRAPTRIARVDRTALRSNRPHLVHPTSHLERVSTSQPADPPAYRIGHISLFTHSLDSGQPIVLGGLASADNESASRGTARAPGVFAVEVR